MNSENLAGFTTKVFAKRKHNHSLSTTKRPGRWVQRSSLILKNSTFLA